MNSTYSFICENNIILHINNFNCRITTNNIAITCYMYNLSHILTHYFGNISFGIKRLNHHSIYDDPIIHYMSTHIRINTITLEDLITQYAR